MEFRLLILLCLLLCNKQIALYAQDSHLPDPGEVADRYLYAVAEKSYSICSRLAKQTSKYLSKFQHQEEKTFKRLEKGSIAVARSLAASLKQNQTLQQNLTGASQKLLAAKKYIMLIEPLAASLKFLNTDGYYYTAHVKECEDMLPWDFLSYQKKPVTQPLKFRFGYFLNQNEL
ncbi:MAG: hypothetical protein JST39_24690 [Bacteroidetes bacterium]|nr:hypothetical protein [Bacteroidota bacterium]